MKWPAGRLSHMASKGWWATLKWLYMTYPDLEAIEPMLEAAASTGDVELFQIICSRSPRDAVTLGVFENACASGNLEMVQTIVNEYGVVHGCGLFEAVRCGHLNVAKWLLGTKRMAGIPDYMVPDCVAAGFYDCAEWLLGDMKSTFKQKFVSREEFEEQIAGVKFGAIVSPPWCTRREDFLWRRRYMELILKHCPEKCLDSDWVGTWAARNGFVAILTRLLRIGYPFLFTEVNLKHIIKTTKAGSMVKLFLEKHPEWLDLNIVCWAAKHHLLVVLKLVFAKGNRFSKHKLIYSAHTAISNAGRHGHLNILKWMHSNGKLVNIGEQQSSHSPRKTAIMCAAVGDHVEITQWLDEQGLVDHQILPRAFRYAIRSEILRFLT